MNNLARIDLDFCYDTGESLTEALAALTAYLPGVTASVVQEVGPGGGWPVVRFEGPAPALVVALAGYNGEDATLEDVLYTLSLAYEPTSP